MRRFPIGNLNISVKASTIPTESSDKIYPSPIWTIKLNQKYKLGIAWRLDNPPPTEVFLYFMERLDQCYLHPLLDMSRPGIEPWSPGRAL